MLDLQFLFVWQHVHLSQSIHSGDALARCWDVEQPTNQHKPAVFSVSLELNVPHLVGGVLRPVHR